MNKESFMGMVEYLRGKRVFIQTHNFPDPDAIGAGFGLLRLLEQFGISSTLCYVGQIDRVNTRKMTELCQIEIYPENELPGEMAPEDPVICVDSQKGGGNIRDLPGDEIACIDHHPLVQGEGYRYLDVRKVGSCSTLIAEYYRELCLEPDELTATALLYGLKMDTLHFTRGVTEKDIAMFSYLFRYASNDILTELSGNNMEFKDLRAYGSAIENIIVYDKIGFAGIPFACQDAQIAVVADFILALEEVDVAVLYADRPDGIKFSVRS
ncbi:MAG: DHH family phosphoesterase, partial [Lachnospiraceae bacterium]|nr:DHH family phosphoesterase [Lachnospiraceae bacterium]